MRHLLIAGAAAFVALTATDVRAAVVDVTAAGFTVRHVIEVSAPGWSAYQTTPPEDSRRWLPRWTRCSARRSPA